MEEFKIEVQGTTFRVVPIRENATITAYQLFADTVYIAEGVS